MRENPHGNDRLQLSKEETWWICGELIEFFRKSSQRSCRK